MRDPAGTNSDLWRVSCTTVTMRSTIGPAGLIKSRLLSLMLMLILGTWWTTFVYMSILKNTVYSYRWKSQCFWYPPPHPGRAPDIKVHRAGSQRKMSIMEATGFILNPGGIFPHKDDILRFAVTEMSTSQESRALDNLIINTNGLFSFATIWLLILRLIHIDAPDWDANSGLGEIVRKVQK